MRCSSIVLLCFFIFLLDFYTVIFVDLKRGDSFSTGHNANLIIFIILFSLAFVSYVCATLTNPGTIPRRWLASSSNKIVFRYCKICRCTKVPRAHHSNHSNRCIMRLDHFCIWINNCVGIRNHKYFFLMLLYCGILGAYTIIIGTIWFIFQIQNYHPEGEHERSFYISFGIHITLFVGSIIYCTIVIGTSLNMLPKQIHIITHNMTTIEKLNKREYTNKKLYHDFRIEKHQYDLGSKYKNASDFFGSSNPIIWFIPFPMPRYSKQLKLARMKSIEQGGISNQNNAKNTFKKTPFDYLMDIEQESNEMIERHEFRITNKEQKKKEELEKRIQDEKLEKELKGNDDDENLDINQKLQKKERIFMKKSKNRDFKKKQVHSKVSQVDKQQTTKEQNSNNKPGPKWIERVGELRQEEERRKQRRNERIERRLLQREDQIQQVVNMRKNNESQQKKDENKQIEKNEDVNDEINRSASSSDEESLVTIDDTTSDTEGNLKPKLKDDHQYKIKEDAITFDKHSVIDAYNVWDENDRDNKKTIKVLNDQQERDNKHKVRRRYNTPPNIRQMSGSGVRVDKEYKPIISRQDRRDMKRGMKDPNEVRLIRQINQNNKASFQRYSQYIKEKYKNNSIDELAHNDDSSQSSYSSSLFDSSEDLHDLEDMQQEGKQRMYPSKPKIINIQRINKKRKNDNEKRIKDQAALISNDKESLIPKLPSIISTSHQQPFHRSYISNNSSVQKAFSKAQAQSVKLGHTLLESEALSDREGDEAAMMQHQREVLGIRFGDEEVID